MGLMFGFGRVWQSVDHQMRESQSKSVGRCFKMSSNIRVICDEYLFEIINFISRRMK